MKYIEINQESEKLLTDMCDAAAAHLKFSGGGVGMVNKLLSLIKEKDEAITPVVEG